MNYPVPLTRAQQLAGLRHVTALLISTGPGGKIESGAGFAAIVTEACALLEACEHSDAVDTTAGGLPAPLPLRWELLVTAGWALVACGVIYAAYQILRSFWVGA